MYGTGHVLCSGAFSRFPQYRTPRMYDTYSTSLTREGVHDGLDAQAGIAGQHPENGCVHLVQVHRGAVRGTKIRLHVRVSRAGEQCSGRSKTISKLYAQQQQWLRSKSTELIDHGAAPAVKTQTLDTIKITV